MGTRGFGNHSVEVTQTYPAQPDRFAPASPKEGDAYGAVKGEDGYAGTRMGAYRMLSGRRSAGISVAYGKRREKVRSCFS